MHSTPAAVRRCATRVALIAVATAFVNPALASLTAQRPAAAPAAGSTSRTATALAGEWIFEMDGDPQPQRVIFSFAGDTIRGKVYGQDLVGSLTNTRIAFAVGDYRWRGTVAGDSITGWLGAGPDSSRWRGTRFRRPATPRAFTLEPKTFYRALDHGIAPALRMAPGDTVHTTTVDAGGWGRGAFGEDGNKRTQGGNPLTGPFYVEGSVPGDVLLVKLHRVRLNRGWAASGTSIVETAIEPSYAAERNGNGQDNKWTLDTIAGVARLTKPTDALRDYTVPLHPFLGVVAVARGGDGAPTSRESGSWGGNLEYSRFRDGTTVMLPVGAMGAYLYVGDGHAAQGDGELTGDAMETTMDVVFSVEIVKWGFNNITRAEDADGIMSVGVGGSLDEAMRRATSDMARWLTGRYQLTANEAAIVMGMSLHFDIPDVVAPGFGVVARVPKSALTQLRTPKPAAKSP
jgi:acetamidase/formamidase